MTAKVIAIVNEKGGCGKTTTAISLARNLELRGFKVVIFDNDPQGGSVAWRNNATDPDKTMSVISLPSAIEAKDLATFKDYVDFIIIDGCPGLDVDKRLLEAASYLNELSADTNISEQVRNEIKQNTYRIFGPSRIANARNTQAIRYSDFVVIPAKASPLDMMLSEGLIRNLINPIFEAQGRPSYGVLINQSKQNNLLLEKKYRSRLKANHMFVFESCILDRNTFRECYDNGTTVMDQPTQTDARQEVEKFVDELLTILKVQMTKTKEAQTC